jgi:hypothetical protein
MTQPVLPEPMRRSPARYIAAFTGLVALYLAPAALGVLILLLAVSRQAGASAFRYVGF